MEEKREKDVSGALRQVYSGASHIMHKAREEANKHIVQNVWKAEEMIAANLRLVGIGTSLEDPIRIVWRDANPWTDHPPYKKGDWACAGFWYLVGTFIIPGTMTNPEACEAIFDAIGTDMWDLVNKPPGCEDFNRKEREWTYDHTCWIQLKRDLSLFY